MRQRLWEITRVFPNDAIQRQYSGSYDGTQLCLKLQTRCMKRYHGHKLWTIPNTSYDNYGTCHHPLAFWTTGRTSLFFVCMYWIFNYSTVQYNVVVYIQYVPYSNGLNLLGELISKFLYMCILYAVMHKFIPYSQIK